MTRRWSVRSTIRDRAGAVAWSVTEIRVTDLPARIETMRASGVRFRNEMEVGPGGRQIQLEDPDGNPIELFEPAR